MARNWLQVIADIEKNDAYDFNALKLSLSIF